MRYTRIGEVDIKDNIDKEVGVTFIAKNITIKNQKDGMECAHITMKDRDKEVRAMIFSISEIEKNKLENGKVYEAVIKITNNVKYGISCIIEKSTLNKTTIDASLFADWVDNIQSYADRLTKLLEMVNNSVYGKIAYDMICKYWDDFTKCPAATGMHHTSFGGLLMHSVCVAEGCLSEGMRYNKIYGDKFININLLVSCALIHDIMKVKELKCVVEDNVVEYSTRSALTTHITDAECEIVMTAMKLGIDVESSEILEMRHLILSHHGELEYGSPITGHMIESKVLNYIDNLDATAWKFNKAYKDMECGESVHSWTSNGIDVIYKGKRKAENEDE